MSKKQEVTELEMKLLENGCNSKFATTARTKIIPMV
jgi:hypothetical protein